MSFSLSAIDFTAYDFYLRCLVVGSSGGYFFFCALRFFGMIIGLLMQIFYVFIVVVVSILPAVPLPALFASAFALVWSYLSSFSFLFPMPVLLVVLGVAISFHIAILIFDFTLWVIHLIRGR